MNLTINGQQHDVDVEDDKPLPWVVRDVLRAITVNDGIAITLNDGQRLFVGNKSTTASAISDAWRFKTYAHNRPSVFGTCNPKWMPWLSYWAPALQLATWNMQLLSNFQQDFTPRTSRDD